MRAVLVLMSVICVVGCGKKPGSHDDGTGPGGKSKAEAMAKPAYTMDGLFGDWKSYETGWKETGKADFKGMKDDIDLKEFYYCNDDNFLYLFFRCTPSVQKRYELTNRSGFLAHAYIDSDSDKTTGASKPDYTGNEAMLGTDLSISIPLGVYEKTKNGNTTEKGCSVSYSVDQWDDAGKRFKMSRNAKDSTDKDPLIAHRGNGVEMAIPLSIIKKKRGDTFTFICVQGMNSSPDAVSKTTITLK